MTNVLMNKTSFMERNDECSHEQIQVLWNIMTNVLMNKTSFMERNGECSCEQNKFYGT